MCKESPKNLVKMHFLIQTIWDTSGNFVFLLSSLMMLMLLIHTLSSLPLKHLIHSIHHSFNKHLLTPQYELGFSDSEIGSFLDLKELHFWKSQARAQITNKNEKVV